MNELEIAKMLDQLAEYHAEMELLEIEFNDKYHAVAGKVLDLESKIRDAVMQHGESVKGVAFHAVYVARKVGSPSVTIRGL